MRNAVSLRIRKRIEEAFGWIRRIGDLAKLKVRGLACAATTFVFAMVARNLVRRPKLTARPG